MQDVIAAKEKKQDEILLLDEWVSRNFDPVTPDAGLDKIAARMGSQKHSCVLVCENGYPVGLISERDLVRTLANVLTGQAVGTARDVMSSPVVTIKKGRPVDEATRRMTSHRIRRLVVVDEHGRAVGLITQSDVVRAHVARIAAHQELLEARVAERTAELQAANKQLETLSRVDPLMGIGNRRGMEEALAIAHRHAVRYTRPYSVILLDIDHFKDYNDTYGHPRGDQVLRDIGREVTGAIRAVDNAFRYGGEELLVLLPETGEDGTRQVAERVRRAVAALAIEHTESPHGIVTISAGIAASTPSADGQLPSIVGLLDAADRSLYQAKDAGRNRIGRPSRPE